MSEMEVLQDIVESLQVIGKALAWIAWIFVARILLNK